MMEPDNESYNCFVDNSFPLGPTGNGALDGLSFAVKDMFDIAGHTASLGHARWRDTHEQSRETAPVIARLLTAGASLAGEVKLDQLAYSMAGNVAEAPQPVNPLYPERWCGGSSSGSAAVVAGGLADFALGSDTAGSIRVPSAACGVYALRPTHRLIDSTGMILMSPSMDTVGLCARQPELLGRVLSVVSDVAQPGTRVERLLIPPNLSALAAPPVVATLLRMADHLAAQQQIKIETLDAGLFDDTGPARLMAALQCPEIWSLHGEWLQSNLSYFDPDIQQRVRLTGQLARARVATKQRDQAAWTDFRYRCEQAIPPGSAVLLPTIPDLIPLRQATERQMARFRSRCLRLTAVSCLAGLPQLTIPVRSSRTDDVYGVSLLGARDQDLSLIDFAAQLGNG